MLKKCTTSLLVALTVFSSSYAWEEHQGIEAKKKPPATKPGPPGPPGPQGPPGPPGVFHVSYASAYGERQTIDSNHVFIPITFEHQRTTSIGMEHPVSNQYERFKIQNSGVYHIGWAITATSESDDEIEISLFNVTQGAPFQSDTLGKASLVANQAQVISGQTIVPLTAGTLFELQVASYFGNALIQPSITVMQIAP
ncbi:MULTISPECIES: hypothetical protein [Parachlamydia]|jgi:hypothetical protein|uniref:C1q domain-containing protein n=2 Tax=Parachlamydia acanthamoebae TaxID=83552 RepID=F8L1A5_PARAV|nr:hypothetical protein [Parachlamydia acanthamoebae]EFB40653.1 hypothetical protein pah_c197o031 [Parachlamydia acanthamoebae str. Hall's coccus]KIA77263.1 hypothetical protein DB43_GQ00050 [Parachlamydia acanthamoebae]CCB87034.1 putative uncharacterized protein [Parachlamydia acanthamoebae UV-7]